MKVKLKIITGLITLITLMFVSGITALGVGSDYTLVDSVLPLNVRTSPTNFKDITITGFSTLEYGNLVCNLTVMNRSTDTDYRVPIYVIGKDTTG